MAFACVAKRNVESVKLYSESRASLQLAALDSAPDAVSAAVRWAPFVHLDRLVFYPCGARGILTQNKILWTSLFFLLRPKLVKLISNASKLLFSSLFWEKIEGFSPLLESEWRTSQDLPSDKKKSSCKNCSISGICSSMYHSIVFLVQDFSPPIRAIHSREKETEHTKNWENMQIHSSRLQKRGWRSVVGLQGHGLICTLGQSMPATDHQRLVACCTPCHGRMTAPCVEVMSFHPACRYMVATCTGWVTPFQKQLKRKIKRYDKLPLLMGTSNDSPQPLLLTTIANAVEQLWRRVSVYIYWCVVTPRGQGVCNFA